MASGDRVSDQDEGPVPRDEDFIIYFSLFHSCTSPKYDRHENERDEELLTNARRHVRALYDMNKPFFSRVAIHDLGLRLEAANIGGVVQVTDLNGAAVDFTIESGDSPSPYEEPNFVGRRLYVS